MRSVVRSFVRSIGILVCRSVVSCDRLEVGRSLDWSIGRLI